ncbi:5-oxoprolinase subunit PxpB [Salinimicrobium flavum]|uniref:5-oxoprolinase subunit PxpB n=1 Tax=Salinimicrobium flavum TaxID=1737065 RepID=A0ABW5J024_9FLAO
MKDFPEIKLMGEKAILIEFEEVINEDLLEKILGYKKFLQEKLFKEKVEVINTYNSLAVVYNSPIEDVYGEVSRVKKLLEVANIANNIEKSLFHIPVCYESDFAPDFQYVSAQKNLSGKQIIELHSAPVYTVFFIGFLPGFLYLGGLDKNLHISRKEQPRLEVQKGSVGIGENQTGIYPQSSPGGWQIIGNSPVPLFDKNRLPPCEISAGDKIKFYPVSGQEHMQITEEVAAETFRFKKEIYEG